MGHDDAAAADQSDQALQRVMAYALGLAKLGATHMLRAGAGTWSGAGMRAHLAALQCAATGQCQKHDSATAADQSGRILQRGVLLGFGLSQGGARQAVHDACGK